MSAPESVVRAVMEALGCCKVSHDATGPWFCEVHEDNWTDRGCAEARLAADAAWVAARREALLEAAERIESFLGDDDPAYVVTTRFLRRMADEAPE
jgi:hypothetical protein